MLVPGLTAAGACAAAVAVRERRALAGSYQLRGATLAPLSGAGVLLATLLLWTAT